MTRTVIFHKPYGVLSQFTHEPLSRFTPLSVFDLPPDVYVAGRLDADSEGMLILTSDKDVARCLTNGMHTKEYLVQVEGNPNAQQLNLLANGVRIKGYRTLPCNVKIYNNNDATPGERTPAIRTRVSIPTQWICLVLREGKNRQIRRMTAAVGLPTLRIIRVAIGELRMDFLTPGKWRLLDSNEVTLLTTPSLID